MSEEVISNLTLLNLFQQTRQAHVISADFRNSPLPTRAQQIQTLQTTLEYDVLVIGGGATGCGVALDSVSRGKSLPMIMS